MIFQTKNYQVDLIQKEDLKEVINIYNSNQRFLQGHMDRDSVTEEWLMGEFESLELAGFESSKIIEKDSDNVIGILDFKLDQETYLSLLMIHNNYKGLGIGNQILHAFEEYLKTQKSNSIRIDVVTNYDSYVTNFWINDGFIKQEEIELNWTGKILPATLMKKVLT